MTADSPTEALQHSPVPRPDEGFLHAVLARHYGSVRQVVDLPGEVDRNFRVEAVNGASWMLKIARPGISTTLQTVIAERLSGRSAVVVPRLIHTLDGESTVETELDGEPVVLRMTEFLDGVSARSVDRTPELFESLGASLAELHVGLGDVDPDLADPDHPWHIRRTESVLPQVDGLPETAETPLMRSALRRCVDVLLPALDELPAQLIHNDLNMDNVLVARDGRSVVGIIDFGDAVAGPRIVDLAVASAYFVRETSGEELVRSLRQIVQGYSARLPLSSRELELLPALMTARWAMALTLNRLRASRHAADADYVAYVERNSVRSTRCLHLMSTLDEPSLVEAVT